jgi:hypothetical protein
VSLFELELIGSLAFLIKNQNSSRRYILSLARMFQLGNHAQAMSDYAVPFVLFN